MERIQVSAVFPSIAPDDSSEFNQVAAEAFELMIPEPGIVGSRLVLLWGRNECLVREILPDSGAMLAHLGSVGGLLRPLIELGGASS